MLRLLKGPALASYEGRLSRLQHSLVPSMQSEPGVNAQHDSCQLGLTWQPVCVCEYECVARFETGQ